LADNESYSLILIGCCRAFVTSYQPGQYFLQP